MKIGQIRKDNSTRYLNSVTSTKGEFKTSISLGSSFLDFKDWIIVPQGGFKYNNFYYVKLKIKNTIESEKDTERSFTISLSNKANQSLVSETEQFLKSFSVPNLRDKTINIQLVFTPNIDFHGLIIRLNRNSIDFNITKSNNYSGRDFQIETEGFEVYNISNIKPSGVEYLNKIGVQGPSGLLMCINGQEIRVGPSGIYETRNGYKINFIGFIIKDDQDSFDIKNYFILDYQYE